MEVQSIQEGIEVDPKGNREQCSVVLPLNQDSDDEEQQV